MTKKSETLKKTRQSIKDNYISKFDELRNSNYHSFVNQIEKLDCLVLTKNKVNNNTICNFLHI